MIVDTIHRKLPDVVVHAQVLDVRDSLPNDPSQAGYRRNIGLVESIIRQDKFEEAVLIGLAMAKDRQSKHDLHDDSDTCQVLHCRERGGGARVGAGGQARGGERAGVRGGNKEVLGRSGWFGDTSAKTWWILALMLVVFSPRQGLRWCVRARVLAWTAPLGGRRARDPLVVEARRLPGAHHRVGDDLAGDAAGYPRCLRHTNVYHISRKPV